MDKEEVRLVLQTALEGLFPDLSVIYRPSGNLKINYPCLLYEPKAEKASYANNLPYTIGTRFQLSFIDFVPGYANTRLVYNLVSQGISIVDSNSFTINDLAHDVFIVSVHTI